MEHNPARLYKGPVGVALEPFVRLARGHGLARNHRSVWWAHRAIWRLTRSNRVLINGFDLETDLHDSMQLARGYFEVEEVAWYNEHIRPGERVLELGTNMGYFACVFSRLVGPAGSYVGYEPDPMLRAIADRNLETNGFGAMAEVREAAVADKAGSATFYRAGRNYGNNALFHYQRDARWGTSFDVRVVTLDEEFPEREFDFVKMDIQGAEAAALEGMATMLAHRPPRLMLLEYWPHGQQQMGRDPREMIDRVLDAGYTVVEVGTTKPIDVDELLVRCNPENQRWVNLGCFRDRADAPIS